MERTELSQQWNAYYEKFREKCPVEYSPDDYAFDAAMFNMPEELLNKARKSDVLQAIRFSRKAVKPLGPLDCSEERMKSLTAFLQAGDLRLACGFKVGKSAPFHVLSDDSALNERDVWFIGDVHGDLLALRSALAFINSNSRKPPVYVFLGDLFDRNPLGLNVLLDVVELIKDKPGQVLWIVGNHDDALSCDDNGVFGSSVTPKQFTDYLNDIEAPVVTAFIQQVIGLVKRLPTGIVLPNGLLATHGGIPSRNNKERAVKNVWSTIETAEIPSYIAEHRRELLMNRFQADAMSGTKMSPDFSWLELANFSVVIERKYGVKIRAYLRGHDHCDLCRHEWATINPKLNLDSEQQNRINDVLTMTTMVQMDEAELTMPGFMRHRTSYPSLAKVLPGKHLPQCFSLVFNDADVTEFYAEANHVHCCQSAEWLDARLNNKLKELATKAKKEEDAAYDAAVIFHKEIVEKAIQKENEANSSLQQAENKLKTEKQNELNVSKQLESLKEELEEIEGEISSKTKEQKTNREKYDTTYNNLNNYKNNWPRLQQQFMKDKYTPTKAVNDDIQMISQKIDEKQINYRKERNPKLKETINKDLNELKSEKDELLSKHPEVKNFDEIKKEYNEKYTEEAYIKNVQDGEKIIQKIEKGFNELSTRLTQLNKDKRSYEIEIERCKKNLSDAQIAVKSAETERDRAQNVLTASVAAAQKANDEYTEKYSIYQECAEKNEELNAKIEECTRKRDDYRWRASK